MKINLKELEELATRCIQVCNKKDWKRDWSSGGCYLHLEVSEFIEALRGKGGRYNEAADVLFVLFAMFRHDGMNLKEVFDRLDNLLTRLEYEKEVVDNLDNLLTQVADELDG